MPSSGRRTVVVMAPGGAGLRFRWRDHGLHAVAGGGVGEGLTDLFQRESGRDEALETELGHQRERAAIRGAAAEGAADPDLAEMHVPEVERQPASLGIDADELEESRWLGHADRLGDQLGLADRLADDVGSAPARELHHLVSQILVNRIDDDAGAETPCDLASLLD